MILRYILSLFLLLTLVFASDVKVIDSFSAASDSTRKHPTQKIERKPVKVLQKVAPKRSLKKRKIQAVHVNHKAKKHQALHIKKSKKAKIVIIIDDISNYKELKKVQSLPFKVTPSIFPPSRMNMHSNRLTKGLKHFMVHLPLESGNKKLNRMYKTLFTNNTPRQIRQRVKEIRKLFPTAKFLNNHTGSKFSKDYRASKILFKALKKEGFTFLDSRTTKDTQFPKIAKEFKTHYYKSDLFIDNIQRVQAIRARIKEGMGLAKKRGYVVMIGHPHKTTLQALRLSKNLLKNFNVIYIDEL